MIKKLVVIMRQATPTKHFGHVQPTHTTAPLMTTTMKLYFFPTINLIGNTYPDNTIATLSLAGTSNPITGIIVGGNFVPTLGQIIPIGVTTGPAIAVLGMDNKIVGVPTNFTDAPNTVAPTA